MQRLISSIDTILTDSDTFCKFTRRLLSSLILSNHNGSRLSQYKYFGLNIYDAQYPSDENTDLIVKMLQDIADSSHSIDNDILPDDLLDNAIYEHTIDVIDKMLKNVKAEKNKSKFDRFRNVLQLLLTVDKDRLLRSSAIGIMNKPQDSFEKAFDNSYDNPFRPTLTDKPFAQKALKIEELPVVNVDPNVIAPITYYSHPYDIELRRLMYPEWQLADPNSIQITTPSELSFDYIDTINALQSVLVDLQESKEIAIDVQNHMYRSFQGFICILQIATRNKVYIIDTIALRSSMTILAPVFANPFIVKVFHCSEKAITWLQRCFSLYIVNCFDTQNAAKLLKYPDTSLAHILQYLGGLILNRSHSMADWRQRPLPLDLLNFARSDVNYLLYVYDCLRRELWNVHGREGLEAVLNASRKSCLKRYEKELFWPLGYRKLLDIPRSCAPKAQDISDEQDTVMAALWQWRDSTARSLDESVHYIMSNSELLRIGLVMPTTASDFQQCQPIKIDESFQNTIIELVISAISMIKPQQKHDSTIPKSPSADTSFDNSKFTSPKIVRSADVLNENTKINPLADRLLCGRALRTPSREVLEAGQGLYSSNLNYSHVDTFTPAVVPSPLQGTSYSNKHSESSPVMPADEIFRLAGWSTPGPYENDAVRSPRASPFFEENFDIMKRKETSIPSSFEEIYAISNLNRKRNKDKKKAKDDDDDTESIDTRTSMNQGIEGTETNCNVDGDMSSSLFDENIYFSFYKDQPDSSISQSMTYAMSIGWIKNNDEYRAILEDFEATCSLAEN